MVPLRLVLRNFMCYREPPEPLVLDGIHIACLTGNNGHGKSALLDAITWALWGKARTSTDDDLIHTGLPEMEVELTFRAGEGVYRVIRKRARARSLRGAGTTTLELQVIGGDGEALSLSGGTVRETQQKIAGLVRMDYDTFTNSAFLLQGRADLFTVKTAAQRKDVLSEILGLGLYDRLEERARASQRDADDRTARYQSELDRMDADLAARDDVARDLAQARADIAALAAEQARRQETVQALQERRQAFEMYQRQAGDLQGRIARGQRDLAVHRADVTRQQQDIDRFAAVVAQRDDILAGVEELRQVRAQVEGETRRLERVRGLERRASALSRIIEESRNALAVEVRLLQQETAQYRQRAERLGEIDDQIAGLGHQEERLRQQQVSLDGRTAEITDMRGKLAFLRETNQQLRKQMEDIRLRRDQIAALDDDAVCPLCKTPLGREGRNHIAEEYQRQGTELGDQHRANDATAKQLTADLKAAETEAANLTNLLAREQKTFTGRQATLVKEHSEAITARDQVVQKAPKLAERETLLASGGYAQEEQRELATVRAELDRLGYDDTALKTAQQRQRDLAHYGEKAAGLQTAEHGLTAATAARDRAAELAAQTEAALREDGEKLAEVQRALAGAEEVIGRLAVAEEELAAVTTRLAARQRVLGGLEERHEQLERLAEVRRDKAADLEDARRDRDAYSDLTTAFGKRGIQALIIEQALPQLEEITNDLLGRMTNNRMAVKLEATRETQRRTQVETLDIKIADELGTRDYDLFSGGEAFRINFALRVALSKLLAHRAGAPLPTLILDEGFGSQDSAGREKLVEVLNAIQDDFECILVITHIEELKEVFPVRIEIVKGVEGSSYRMAV